MYWPPNFTSNNIVTFSDDRFVEENPGDPVRFDPFTQAVCVLAPWFAWAGVDTRWTTGDPMCRVLLVGEPTEQLYSVNADGVGSIFQLGSVGAGLQFWEVVSYFDWYVDDDAGKVGCMAIARLYAPAGGGGGGGGDPGVGGVFIDFASEEPSDLHEIEVEATDGILCVMIATDMGLAIPISVEYDGEAMTWVQQIAASEEDDIAAIMYALPVSAGTATLSILFADPTNVAGSHITVVNADAWEGGSMGTNEGFDSSPSCEAAAPTADLATVTICFAVLVNALSHEHPFDAPATSSLADNITDWCSTRAAWVTAEGTSTPEFEVTITTADQWLTLQATFFLTP